VALWHCVQVELLLSLRLVLAFHEGISLFKNTSKCSFAHNITVKLVLKLSNCLMFYQHENAASFYFDGNQKPGITDPNIFNNIKNVLNL
jgi:hypothetical protein